MDNRRWDSHQIIDGGILNLPVPESRTPSDAVLTALDDGGDYNDDEIRRGLEAGGVKCSQYYGVWSIWKTQKGFSGELFQYRQVTESFDDVPLDEATERANNWLAGCCG